MADVAAAVGIDPCHRADVPTAAAEAARHGVAAAIHRDDFLFAYHIAVQTDPDPDRVRALVTRYYFEDGARSVARLDELVGRLHPEAGKRRLSLLEFASGYGCLTRHLVRLGERFDTVACDIHPQAVSFLRDVIGAGAIGSASDPGRFRTGRMHDVVFALSFFSHMPPGTFGAWIRALFAGVAEGGLLVFTTNGRVGYREVGRPPLQPDGHWFTPSSEQHDLPTEEYGCMVATPAFVLNQLMALEDAELVLFEEAAWWSTQDLFVVRRRRDGFARPLSPPPPDPAVAEAALIRTFTRSTSWRVTRPLRAVGRLARALRDRRSGRGA